ncbi:MAG: amidohydrolase [Bacteroidetes bacterium]|nr:amidohydrolase [Bacteroidota bacterium]MDA0937715.1 amidohydrolase [Bacteroidota bacterium]MDA1344319.1 amidohydrolase [Bacteroidota bacterium]
MKNLIWTLFLLPCFVQGQKNLEAQYQNIEEKVIQWRHEIHQNPELSNREFNTAQKVADHLRALGMEVQTGVAHTGVVGILKGKKPGKVVALRADMDALPVTERNALPYRSEVVSQYNGQEVGVMHACGHDTHVAILMGAAEILAKNNNFAGTVKFIFQPAEEGAPEGEKGGAKYMIEEGVLQNPNVDAIFGLHINSGTHVGKIRYKPRGTMAASQRFVIDIQGKQAHGSTPWQSVDPIVTGAQIITGLQTLISRNSELTKEAAVVSVGSIHSGVRFNIIPESLQMVGTIRTLDRDMKEVIRERMKTLVTSIAEAHGATATVDIQDGTDITYNDPELTAFAVKSLQKVAGSDQVELMRAITGAEDFSYFQSKIPGFYFFLGGTPTDVPEADAPSHHTPGFYVDDASLLLGVKAMTQLTLDYLKN